MPRDAKFGLVVGMGVVILMAVIFFRREQVDTVNDQPPTTNVKTQVTNATSPGTMDGAFRSGDENGNKVSVAVNRSE